MKAIFAFFLILILAFAGYHRSFRRMKLPLMARRFYLTGIEYLVLGFVLGPSLLNILDLKTLQGLAPLSSLVLGWIGLLAGFQFEFKKIRRLPKSHLGAAGVAGGITALLVFAGAWCALPAILSLPPASIAICALAMAGAAACTAQVSLALSPHARSPENRPLATLIQVISSADGALALAVFSLAFLLRPDSSQAHHIAGLAPKILLCILGQFMLFALFLHKRRSEEEITVVLMGIAILGSGMAAMLDFSPLVTNFATGVLLVNFTREKERLYGMIASVEKPAYLLLLVFLGATWQLDSIMCYVGGILYFLWRLLAKTTGGYTAVVSISSLRGLPSHMGLGLVDHGGMALAILLDFCMSFPSAITIPVVSTVLIGVIMNELLSPAIISLVLKRRDHAS